jgi:biopolymer transport protein TolR
MFSTGGSSGGFRGRRRFGASQGVLSEMNVVPLVDVVLVLLIIFMLTAHVIAAPEREEDQHSRSAKAAGAAI